MSEAGEWAGGTGVAGADGLLVLAAVARVLPRLKAMVNGDDNVATTGC
ncbi:MAG: hypothetical protein ACK6A8_14475 [Planctomycetota bacterium]